MDVHTALDACRDLKLVRQRLQVLEELGLGYLTLGEETPSLSGGEAQRLKLASEMGRAQDGFRVRLRRADHRPAPAGRAARCWACSRRCIDHGATVVVIEHDLDVIRNADYIIDMGPGGGEEGGRDRRFRHAGGHPPRR